MYNYSFKPKIERSFQLFVDFGFKYLHWCEDWNKETIYSQHQMASYHDLLNSFGLTCLDVHGVETSAFYLGVREKSATDRYIQLLENRIEFCSAVGGDAVVIHPPNVENPEELNCCLKRSLHIFEQVRPLCEDLGVTIAVENCNPYDEPILKYYFARYLPEFVGFCFDSGHAHLNRNLEAVFQFSGRLKVLHLHDNRGKNDEHQPPLWGTLDWEKIMQWITGSNYQKPLNFEITLYPSLFDGSMEDYLVYTVRMIHQVLSLR
jgi:sugar phosphate isomerase/epimerase